MERRRKKAAAGGGKKRRSRLRLGRGLDSLLGPAGAVEGKDKSSGKKSGFGGSSTGSVGGGGKGREVLHLDIERIAPGAHQPRKRFPEKELKELADSIARHGLLQPVLVRPFTAKDETAAGGGKPEGRGDGQAARPQSRGGGGRRRLARSGFAGNRSAGSRSAALQAAAGRGAPPGKAGDHAADYLIIAGERRWRAAAKAGLHKLPVIVCSPKSEEEEAVWALTENIQRSDLNPLEEAEAYQQLMQGRKGLTQEKLAKILGRARASVANQLRLLKLAPQVKEWLREGRLSFSQAREIAGEKSARLQKQLAKLCIKKEMTVRSLQKQAARGKPSNGKTKAGAGAKHGQAPAWALTSLSELRELSGRNIRLNYAKGKGGLSFPFRSEKDLKRLFHALWPKS